MVKGEKIMMESKSMSEQFSQTFDYESNQVIACMPGVVGHKGGVAQVKFTRQNGEIYSMDIPWGDVIEEYFAGKKRISFVDYYHKLEAEDPDFAQAELDKAVEAQDPEAITLSATLTTDKAKAKELFLKAAQLEYPSAQLILGGLLIEEATDQAGKREGVNWIQRAAKNDYPNAQFILAIMITNGDAGIKKDPANAFAYALKASQKHGAVPGLKDAQNFLAELYFRGEGTEVNLSKAFYWFEQSAQQGYAEAQVHAGLMHLKGEGIPQNYSKAFYWFNEAAKQQNGHAEFLLGYMYKEGLGVKEDKEKALQLFILADSHGYANAQKLIEDMRRR